MSIDHTCIPSTQADIHATLLNWARWVLPRQRAYVHPMFRGYRPPWDETKGGGIPIDGIEARAVEKVIGAMPSEHALSLRWWYVYPVPASRVCQHLGCTHAGLHQMVIDARCMVRNRLRAR